MGLETATKISELNTSWPLSTDPKSQGDNHIRTIKAVLAADVASLADGGAFAAELTFGGSAGLSQASWSATDNVSGFRLAGASLNIGGVSSLGAGSNAIGNYWGGVNNFAVRRTGNVVNSNNSYGALSDERLKTEIADASPKLDDLNRLRIVNFALKDDPAQAKQIGVVAQEAREVFPGLVEESADGTLSFKYSVLVPMLVKAVQELTARVEALEARG